MHVQYIDIHEGLLLVNPFFTTAAYRSALAVVPACIRNRSLLKRRAPHLGKVILNILETPTLNRLARSTAGLRVGAEPRNLQQPIRLGPGSDPQYPQNPASRWARAASAQRHRGAKPPGAQRALAKRSSKSSELQPESAQARRVGRGAASPRRSRCRSYAQAVWRTGGWRNVTAQCAI